jgi:hypothetical protein
MNRTITDHHDGHGLNDKIRIEADAKDMERGGGASHRYFAVIDLGPSDSTFVEDLDERLSGSDNPVEYVRDSAGNRAELTVAEIQFQHGPRADATSMPGITEAVLYAILLDRLRAFQAGPFPSKQNEEQIELLERCLISTKGRADERAARGVLGKNEK